MVVTEEAQVGAQRTGANLGHRAISSKLAGSEEVFGAQEGVHGAGAETFQVEGYEFESQSFENPCEFGGSGGIEGAGQFVLGDLDADDLTVMAHAELAEAEGAESVFSLLDCGQGFAGDGAAVFDAGGEASGGRLVPDTQSGRLREITDVLLGQGGVEQWGGDVVLTSSLLARTEVALVVEVHAVGDGIEAAGVAKGFHDGEEFVFAMEAARGVVARVFGAIEFGGGDDFERNASLPGEGDRVGELSAREAGRVGDHGQHARAERLMSGPGEVGGIDSAGVGDEKASEGAKALLEVGLFECELGGDGHGFYANTGARDVS